MNAETKAVNAAIALTSITWDLAMAAKYNDEAYIDRARTQLLNAVAILDGPEVGTLSPINGE